jgi:uncharacterized membrane protein
VVTNKIAMITILLTTNSFFFKCAPKRPKLQKKNQTDLQKRKKKKGHNMNNEIMEIKGN